MAPPFGNKNPILSGEALSGNLYSKPDELEQLFEKLEKPIKLTVEPRPTYIKVGVLKTVKGSAYMEYGNTKVIAQVNAPREMGKHVKRGPLGIVNCFVGFAAFATSDLSSVPRREKLLGNGLRKALEPMICRHEFTNFQLDVRVLILDDDGCLLSTAVNCCGVALAECGVSTYDMISASTACIYRGVVFISPNALVEHLLDNLAGDNTTENGSVVIASLSTFSQVAACFQTGYLTPETFIKLSELTLDINNQLLDTVRHVLVERVKIHHTDVLKGRAEELLEDQQLETALQNLMKKNDAVTNYNNDMDES